MNELGQVLNRDTLDESSGARARMRIAVLEAWVKERATVLVEAPERVECARCEGGGCDTCERRGGFRLGADVATRSFPVSLPAEVGDGIVVRVPHPFASPCPGGLEIAQMLCEVRCASVAVGCRRVASERDKVHDLSSRPSSLRSRVTWTLASLVLLTIATLGWLLGR